MNDAEIEQCRQKLLKLRTELLELEESSKDAAQPPELDQTGISRRDAMQARQMAEEGGRRRKRQLQKIDGALRRIQAGEFGNCFICEVEIDAARLADDPTVTRCPDCVEE